MCPKIDKINIFCEKFWIFSALLEIFIKGAVKGGILKSKNQIIIEISRKNRVNNEVNKVGKNIS